MKNIDQKPKIRIIIPCHNEEGNIQKLILRLKPLVSAYDYSILFVDDGSTDGTLAKLRSISAVDARVLYISLSRNFGQQNALKAGYDHSLAADVVISMDGDLQHPPEVIPKMIRLWEKGYEIINTIRGANHRVSYIKRTAAKLFYGFVNLISANKILENGPDYRLLDRKVVLAVSAINENNLYWKELIPWIGFKQTEIGFNVERRHTGTSKYSLRKSIALSLRGVTSFSINPLRLSSLLGGAFSLLSFLYGLYAVYVFFFTDDAVPGWTSLIGSILLIAGIQFILIGIIGEYLGKTFLETKKRPLYIVREDKSGQGLPKVEGRLVMVRKTED